MNVDDLELRRSPVPVRVVPLERRALVGPLRVEGVFRPTRQVMLTSPGSGRVSGLELTLGAPVERNQELCRVGQDVAEQRVMASEANIHQLRAQLAEREDAVNLARARNDSPERIVSLQSKTISVRERLEQELVTHRRHQRMGQSLCVRAPFRGTVAALHTESGGTLVAGKPILKLVAVRPILLDLGLPTALAARCHVGRRIPIDIASADEIRKGLVVRWAPTATDDVRRVQIELSNDDGMLAAGERATAIVEVGARTAFCVLRDALRTTHLGVAVMVVEHGRIVSIPVHVVSEDGPWVEVVGRLRTGMNIVHHAERPIRDKSEVVVRSDH